MFPLKKRNQRGVMTGDTGLMLAIAGAFITIAVITFRSHMSTVHEGDASRMLGDLYTKIRSNYVRFGAYGDGPSNNNLIPALLDNKLIDLSVVVGSGTSAKVIHPWDGEVKLIGAPAGNTRHASISFTQLDKDSCIYMSKYSASKSYRFATVTKVSINSTILTLPVTETAIRNACADNDTNAVTMEFY